MSLITNVRQWKTDYTLIFLKQGVNILSEAFEKLRDIFLYGYLKNIVIDTKQQEYKR